MKRKRKIAIYVSVLKLEHICRHSYPLNASENHRFFDIIRGYKKRPAAQNRLSILKNWQQNLEFANLKWRSLKWFQYWKHFSNIISWKLYEVIGMWRMWNSCMEIFQKMTTLEIRGISSENTYDGIQF